MIYLDYAASMPLFEEVVEELTQSLKSDFANSSAAHSLGRDLAKREELSRKRFLNEVSANLDWNFIFTSSATESNNTIIKGIGLTAGDGIFITHSDHASITVPVDNLIQKNISIFEIPILDGGMVDIDQLAKKMNSSIKLIALTHINNQSGIVQNIKEISDFIKSLYPDVHIHIDAVQSFAKYSIDLTDIDIDSISISSHKIGGPKGIAGLYFKKRIKLSPLLLGGGHEQGMRSSTVAIPLVFGFEKALNIYSQSRDNAYCRVKEIKKRVVSIVKDIFPAALFPFGEDVSSPYILSFIFSGISSDIVLRHFERKKIFLSSTSACSSRIKGENRVFTAMKIDKKYHKSILRLSFSHLTTDCEIDAFAKAFEEIYSDLKILIKR